MDAPRWLLLVTLVYAPWAFGCTLDWTVGLLEVLLGCVLISWGIRCWLRKSWPRIHPVLIGSCAWLILQAWWMSLNGTSTPNQSGASASTASLFASAPGSINPAASTLMALRITLLLGAACFACDLARHSLWRKRLYWTMGLTGTSVIVLGLMQRLGNAPGIFWNTHYSSETFFATYDYHANAGSFINLTWPLMAGLLVSSLLKGTSLVQRIFWTIALSISLVGVFVNTSRAASFLCVVLLLVLLIWFAFFVCRRLLPQLNLAVVLVTLFLLLLIVGGAAIIVGTERTYQHWSVFQRNELNAQNPRLLSAQVCLEILPEAHALGFGPGTFKTILTTHAERVKTAIPPNLDYAHQDYLQTILEWGFLGAAFWFVLLFGSLAYATGMQFKHGAQWPSKDRVLYFVVLVSLLGVAAHALVDYPFQIASIQLYIVVLVGVLWSSRSWQSHRETEHLRKAELTAAE